MTTALQNVVALPNKGPVTNKPPEFLADAFSPYSRNMQFYNELCQGRGGLGKFSTTELSGPVLMETHFTDVAGNSYVIFGTSKDIYSYDFGNARFDIITPTYTTGTIEVKVGELNKVYGSGTPNWTSNLKAGDFIKIGSGSIHTGSTWYEIASVDSNTLLTLTSNAVITAAGTAYVARKTFIGSDNSYWDWTEFADTNLGNIIVMTNGTAGGFVRWGGSGQVVPVSTGLVSFTTCKFVSTYAGRVLIAYTIEGGEDQKQRERWSAVADITTWDALDFIDFADEPTAISGLCKFNNYSVTYKEEQAYVGRYVGGDAVFSWDLSAQSYGARSPYSIVVRNDFIYYYGHDKKFHRFNLLQDEIISEQLFPDTKEFDPNQDRFIAGFNVNRSNEVRWFCPYGSTTKHNYVFVWNYQQNIPQVWEYANEDACCSMGEYYLTDSVYFDDATFGARYFDEVSGYFDDISSLANAAITIYGGYDGIVRFADSGVTDDGSSFTRTLRLKRQNFGIVDKKKRLWKQIWWLESQISGSVLIRLMLDDKSSFEAATKIVSLVPSDADKQVIKPTITWDKEAQNFQPELSSTDHFAVLALISLYFPKKRSFLT